MIGQTAPLPTGSSPATPSIADAPPLRHQMPVGEFRTTVGSPVILGIAALTAFVAAVVVNYEQARDGTIWSEAQQRVIGVLGPFDGEILLRAPFDGRTRVGLALAGLAFVLVVAWTVAVVRAPHARPETVGTIVVALIGLPTFWMIPGVVGDVAGADLDELRLRYDVMLVFAISAGLARVLVTARIWRAGRLPVELASLVISLPAAITALVWLIPSVITLHSLDANGLGDSVWEPTENTLRLAEYGAAFSFFATIALLVTATIAQRVRAHQEHEANLARIAQLEAEEDARIAHS